MFCFYHKTVFSGFDLIPGDNGDSRFNMLIAEHWIDYLTGKLKFHEVRMFYPADYSFGFSDLALMIAVFELPFRICGFDIFRSYQISLWIFHFLGILGSYYLLRRVLHLRIVPVSISIVVICFANSLVHKLNHTQFYAYFLLPFFLIFVIRYCQCTMEDKFWKRLLYGVCGVITLMAIIYTSYYTVFFVFFFTITFLPSLCLMGILRQNINDFYCLGRWIKLRILDLPLFALFTTLCMTPFYTVYYPLIRMGFRRNWNEIRISLPLWSDFINPGNGNILWSKPFAFFFSDSLNRTFNYELCYGFPCITFFIILVVIAYCLVKARKNMKISTVFISAVMFALVVCSIAILQRSDNMSCWKQLRYWIPGASAIRTVSRILVIFLLPVGVCFGIFFNDLQEKFSSKKSIVLLLAVLFAVLLDHANVSGFETFSIKENRDFISSVASPPEDCKIFFVTKQRETPLGDEYKGEVNYEKSIAQLNAMLIA